jgi:hypothetical protein
MLPTNLLAVSIYLKLKQPSGIATPYPLLPNLKKNSNIAE